MRGIRDRKFGFGKAFTLRKAKDDEEWREMRRGGIGGSDVAPIMGMSPYRTALDVWLEKTGRSTEDVPESEAMYWGTVNEEAIARRFAEEHPDMQVTKVNQQLVSCESAIFLADLDRLVVCRDGSPAVLEAKTASAYKADEWKDGVPAYYLTQVQHYLMVTGWKTAYVAALIGGNSYHEYKIARDDDDISAIKAAELEFWNEFVAKNVMPEVVGGDLGTLAEMHGNPGEEYATPSDIAATDELIRVYQEAAADEKAAAARKKDAQAKLCSVIGDSKGIVTDVAKVTWSRSTSQRFDAGALKQESPETYEKYVRPCNRSSLRITEAR